jgi:hypothetical protein
MSIFWLCAAVALFLVGRYGTTQMKPSSLGGVAFGFCQLGMLACLGLAFFALFDPPPPSSIPVSGGLERVGLWTALALGGPIILGLLAASLHRRHRLGKDDLVTAQLTLSLDRAAGLVHITERGQVMTHRVAIGRLVIDVAPYEENSHQRAVVTVRQWPASKQLSPETAARGMADVLKTDVYINTARDVTGWLRRHPGIELDAETIRRDWNAQVDAMVRYVRGQRLVDGKPAVEAWVAGDGPSLDYLVIEQDGRVFGGVGEEPLIERITTPLASDGARRIRVTIGDFRPTFALDNDQVAVVGKLHARGLLSVEKQAL